MGQYGLPIIIFAETGLLLGFFLPGDSLLFIAGIYTATNGDYLPSLPITALVVAIAAIAGDQVGYLFGRKVGPSLFQRSESRFFKPQHVERAHAFLELHGSKTIVLARFVPVVRTFAPFVAGVSDMTHARFQLYNFTGAILWVFSLVTGGYFFGNIPVVRDHLTAIVLVGVGAAAIPVALGALYKVYQRFARG